MSNAVTIVLSDDPTDATRVNIQWTIGGDPAVPTPALTLAHSVLEFINNIAQTTKEVAQTTTGGVTDVTPIEGDQ